ncbi:MAG: T9SS type A sorting domain-containing protein [Bacteroidetes bacterium]|nr:T9SS type A sorting domain-containing protein [Bacteroidota bacterium]
MYIHITAQLQPHKEELTVFPNPFDASITITLPLNAGKPVKVIISSVSGQKIYEQIPGSEFSTIQIKSDLRSGIYFLEVITSTSTFKKRICKL